MADRDRIRKLEYDLSRIARQIVGLPVRRAEGCGSGEPLPFQIAVVTDATGGPHTYAGSGLTFGITGGAPDGRAILLDTTSEDVWDNLGALLVDVDTAEGSTLDELKFGFLNIHRDIPIGVGDVIRVWTEDGTPVSAGMCLIWSSHPMVFAELFNVTDYLRNLGGYDDDPVEPLALATSGGEIAWTAFPEGTPGEPGTPGTPGTPGPGVAEGYAIDVTGTDPRIVALNPKEITGWSAASFQFFAHDLTAGETTDPDDPPWKTIAQYDATKKQLPWHQSGAFNFETTTDYGGSATEPQFLVNWGAGNGGEWQWKSVINYDTAKDQIIWSDNGSWKAEEANKLTPIKIPTSIALTIEGTAPNQTLKVQLNYTEYTFYGLAGNTGNMSATVDADPC